MYLYVYTHFVCFVQNNIQSDIRAINVVVGSSRFTPRETACAFDS